MLTIIRLIRLPNLFIIALTMYLTRYCLLIEFDIQTSKFTQIPFTLSDFGFGLLVLSVVFIAAAGYIINDYFDTRIDAINKPEKLIVGVKVTRRQAMLFHTILNVLGLAIGFYLAWQINKIVIGWVNVITVTLLWYYSRYFKKKFIIGNVVVALLSGMIPIVVALFEPDTYKELYYFIFGYAAFAFVVSLIREIIKDLEDMEGDITENCKTIPIVSGVRATKTVIIILIALVIAMIGFLLNNKALPEFSSNRIFILYSVIAIQLPLMILIYLTYKATSKNNYHLMSTLTKIIMLTGVLSMLVFYYFPQTH
jgi:4-hydroxybenzoate polyprenyltransferase